MNSAIKSAIAAYTYYDQHNVKKSGKTLLKTLITKDKNSYLNKRIVLLKRQISSLESKQKQLSRFISISNLEQYSDDTLSDVAILYSFISEHGSDDPDFSSFINSVAINISTSSVKIREAKYELQVIAFKLYSLNTQLNNLTNNSVKYDTILNEIDGI